jgi:protein-S-isoprenylcysteine O-methyltransferase Ste14
MNTQATINDHNEQDDVARGVRTWIRKSITSIVLTAVIVLAAAGRLDWVWGWALVGVYVLFQGVNALVFLPRNPELLAERSRVQKGTKTWDVIIAGLAAAILPMVQWLVAGLDERYGWSPDLPTWLQLASLGVALAGYGFTLWAMAVNSFFSATVRIQDDRNHRVVTSGPYRLMRHPGYVGAILFQLAVGLMMDSLWALVPGGLSAILYVIRTAMEDRTLQRELPGYREYTQQTRYRLIPGIW